MCNPVFCCVYGNVFVFVHGGGEDPGNHCVTVYSVVCMVMFTCFIHGSGEDPGIYCVTPFSVVCMVMFMCVNHGSGEDPDM